MGVSGVGKSTVAQQLAIDLDLEPAEGDDFHPEANIAKMSAGDPLTDEDRRPWLEELARWTAGRRADGRDTVLTCSALKRAYRDVLREGAPDTFFVCLTGDESLLLERMESREHFMPASLLRSQLDILEPLADDERGTTLDVVLPVGEIVARVRSLLPSTTM